MSKRKIIKDHLFWCDKWIKATSKYHLRIRDIKKMKKGQKIYVLGLDRNFPDALYDSKIIIGKVYKPENLFKVKKYTYIHDSGFKGNFDVIEDFEFHIEYKKDHWFPLKDGKLSKTDMREEGLSTKKIMNFPPSTKIGFRGPMILWKNVKKLPLIKFVEES